MHRPAAFTGHHREAGGVVADLGGPAIALSAIEPDVLRIRFSPTGSWAPRRPWAVTDLDGRDPVELEVHRRAGGLTVGTSSLEAAIDQAGRLSISTKAGRELLSDSAGVAWHSAPARCEWTQRMPADRHYFGFGERTGLLEKRGHRYTAWTTDEWSHQGPETDPLYIAIPFHLALDPDGTCFGVFLDSTYRSAFDLTGIDDGDLTMSVETAEMDWFFIHGPEPAAVVERFTRLVGRPQLPPRWALGYHQARWSYGSEAEVLEIADNLRHHRIPTDAVNLDIDHMDRFRSFTWDPRRFPDPARMTTALRDRGLRTTVIVDAGVPVHRQGYPIYDKGHRLGHFVRRPGAPHMELTAYLWGGISAFPDFARDDVRRWWGSQYRGYLDVGVAGFFNDMNEPAMHDRPFDDPRSRNTEPPPDTPFGRESPPATHAEVRNVYALLQNRGTAEALREARPDERPFLVTRAGFAGLQRDAMAWTGDNWSYWEHLEMSLPQILNLGLSGVPLAGADIGGFFADCPPELLVRWTQLGAFYPLARNNSAQGTARQEPWVWGEPTTSRCRRAIELRYRLLPYLYTVVAEACSTGRPVLRPLFFHEPADGNVHALGDEALVGRDLLIAPVLRPGKTSREVYLPEGGWYDVRDGTAHPGGRVILTSAGLDEDVPVFARAGAIVPMGPVVQWTGDPATAAVSVHVFPDADGSAAGELYEDDGESLGYARGDWSRTRFEARRDGTRTTVRIRRNGSYGPRRSSIELLLHRDGATTPTVVEDAAELEVSL